MACPIRSILTGLAVLAGTAPLLALGNFCATSPNAAGPGAVIDAVGSTSISAGDFTLTVAGAHPDTIGMFFYGGGEMQYPFGNGFRCVRTAGRGVHRFKGIKHLDSTGRASLTVDFSRRPAGAGKGTITAASTWYFQFIYRDPAGPGGQGFNLSDGLRATFTN